MNTYSYEKRMSRHSKISVFMYPYIQHYTCMNVYKNTEAIDYNRSRDKRVTF